MKKWKEKRTMGPKLDAEKGTGEGEWRQYKDAFVGVAGELCGRSSAKAVGEKREAWKMIEGFRDRGEQPPIGLRHLYGQKKAAIRAVDSTRRSMAEELYRKLDEDGGKKMIFKMARDRTEDGRKVKRGAVIKDNNGRFITESKEVFRIWAANFNVLLNGNGAASCLELPSLVRREVEVEDIGQEEVETAMHKMKKRKATGGRRGAATDDGDGWRGGSQVDRKATECVYAGGKGTEGVDDGPDSADMEQERGCYMHDPGKYTWASHYSAKY